MSFTILGASGSIGSLLQTHLESQQEAVYAPVRGEAAVFERPLGHVVYCVGLTADFRTRRLETVEAHVWLLREVLERGSYDSLTYLSSTRVYRGVKLGEEAATLAVRPGDPDDLYNLSKLLGESLCLGAEGGDGKVVRLSNVIGPGAQAPSFALSLVRDAVAGGTIHLQTHPDSAKDYVDIRDVVALLPQVATRGFGVYNVASGVQTTHRELAETIASITGARVVAEVKGETTNFPPISVDRIAGEFGFAPRPLRGSLEDMVAAELASG